MHAPLGIAATVRMMTNRGAAPSAAGAGFLRTESSNAVRGGLPGTKLEYPSGLGSGRLLKRDSALAKPTAMVDWAVARKLGSTPFRASWAKGEARRGSLWQQRPAQAFLPTERGYGRPSRNQMLERSLLAWRLQRSYGVLQL